MQCAANVTFKEELIKEGIKSKEKLNEEGVESEEGLHEEGIESEREHFLRSESLMRLGNVLSYEPSTKSSDEPDRTANVKPTHMTGSSTLRIISQLIPDKPPGKEKPHRVQKFRSPKSERGGSNIYGGLRSGRSKRRKSEGTIDEYEQD